MWLFGVAVGVAAALLVLPLILLRLRVLLRRRRPRTLGVLHPYCNDGGGGERVLWVAIRELLARGVVDAARWRVVVYTGDAVGPAEIRAHAASRFGVDVPAEVEFVYLACRGAIEARRYPVATLLGQALGSLVVAAEAIWRAPPDVLVDTTGLAFCYPLARAAGVGAVAAYVHYPTITSEMVGVVASRTAAHNNSAAVARSPLRTAAKLGYYRALAALYAFAGRRAAVVAANGSWTAAHLRELWAGGAAVRVVFPPCDTASLRALPLARGGGARDVVVVLSVAQFRPEKDHALQLRAFSLLRARWRAAGGRAPEPRLVLAGAVRHAADGARLDALRDLARELELAAPAVEFAPNLSVVELRALYGRAAVGLHTMWNEHFGIGVVEMMAAGVVPVAHASGGPALDIVGTDGASGLLAATAEEYADALASLLVADGAAKRRATMAAAARDAVAARFSEDAFADGFCDAMRPLFT